LDKAQYLEIAVDPFSHQEQKEILRRSGLAEPQPFITLGSESPNDGQG